MSLNSKAKTTPFKSKKLLGIQIFHNDGRELQGTQNRE